MHPGSHSHDHTHGQGHGQGHVHHPGCSHGQQHEIDPEEYFKQLSQLKQKNIEFYWMQILKGAVLAKYLQKFKLGFINSINAHLFQGIIGMVHMMLTFDWIPLIVRPFVSGMFWMIFVYIFVNYKIITGFSTNDQQKQTAQNVSQLDRTTNTFIICLPLVLYALVALRTSGQLNTPANKKIAKRALQIRPYLQNPNFMCRVCDIPKAFRSAHCPICKICTPKFSRHSLVFGVCIGAANQLLSIMFFLSMSIFSGYCLYKFTTLRSLYGVITQIMVYLLNISICWMSFTEVSNLFILNIRFGITEFQIQNWMMLQYLMKAPIREFLNSCNNGAIHNFAQSVYALFNISGFQLILNEDKYENQQRQNQPLKQQISSENKNLSFPQVQQGVKYIINWNKAFIYVIPQMPNHPRRKQILNIMKVQQPKMIANYKLLKKFKKQAQDQNPGFNQFQIQQRAMMKMNQHLMKNPAALNIMKPPPQQQKIIQLQMLTHMKMQFKTDPQIYNGFEEVQNRLKSGKINPDQATFQIRAIQQKVMEKKMKQIMEAQKAQLQSQGQSQSKTQNRQTASPTRQNQMNLQSMMQAQMLQRLEERSRQRQSKQEQKTEQKIIQKTQKQEESEKLKGDDAVEENNL